MQSVLIATSLMIAASGDVQAWQFVGASNDLALFVDDASVVTDGTARQVWVIGIPDARSEIGQQAPGSYVLAAHRVDCSRRTDAVTHFTAYTNGGDIIGERADPYPESPVAPYGAGELVYAYVCKGEITTDKVVKLHTLAEVKSFGRNWLEVYDRLEAMKQRPR